MMGVVDWSWLVNAPLFCFICVVNIFVFPLSLPYIGGIDEMFSTSAVRVYNTHTVVEHEDGIASSSWTTPLPDLPKPLSRAVLTCV
jgi:hypothetical protein